MATPFIDIEELRKRAEENEKKREQERHEAYLQELEERKQNEAEWQKLWDKAIEKSDAEKQALLDAEIKEATDKAKQKVLDKHGMDSESYTKGLKELASGLKDTYAFRDKQ